MNTRKKNDLAKLCLKPTSTKNLRKSKSQPTTISEFFQNTAETEEVSARVSASSTTNETAISSNIEINNINEKLRSFKNTSKRIAKLSTQKVDPKPPLIVEFFEHKASADNNATLNDFEAPPVNKKTRVTKTQAPIKNKRKTRTTSNKKQNDLRNFVKNQEKNLNDEKLFAQLMAQQSTAENVDPDELQMALALSRSIAESFGSQENSNQNEISSEKSNDIQHCLEKFGFKSSSIGSGSGCYSASDLKSILKINRNFKWRKKYTTKNLNYFNKKIEEKISMIFLNENTSNAQENKKYKIISDKIKLINNDNSKLYDLQSSSIETDINLHVYYTGNLVDTSTIKVGYLLKNWNEIPGRDKSPDRLNLEKNSFEENVNILKDNVNDNEIDSSPNNGNISSDLFSSSDNSDTETETKSNETIIAVVKNITVEPKDCISDENIISDIQSDIDQSLTKSVLNGSFRIIKSPEKNLFRNCIKSPILYKEDERKSTRTSLNDSIQFDEIIHFENFSSDEVKIGAMTNSKDISCQDMFADISTDCIDLTQEDESDIAESKKISSDEKISNIEYLKNQQSPLKSSQSSNCSKVFEETLNNISKTCSKTSKNLSSTSNDLMDLIELHDNDIVDNDINDVYNDTAVLENEILINAFDCSVVGKIKTNFKDPYISISKDLVVTSEQNDISDKTENIEPFEIETADIGVVESIIENINCGNVDLSNTSNVINLIDHQDDHPLVKDPINNANIDPDDDLIVIASSNESNSSNNACSSKSLNYIHKSTPKATTSINYFGNDTLAIISSIENLLENINSSTDNLESRVISLSNESTSSTLKENKSSSIEKNIENQTKKSSINNQISDVLATNDMHSNVPQKLNLIENDALNNTIDYNYDMNNLSVSESHIYDIYNNPTTSSGFSSILDNMPSTSSGIIRKNLFPNVDNNQSFEISDDEVNYSMKEQENINNSYKEVLEIVDSDSTISDYYENENIDKIIVENENSDENVDKSINEFLFNCQIEDDKIKSIIQKSSHKKTRKTVQFKRYSSEPNFSKSAKKRLTYQKNDEEEDEFDRMINAGTSNQLNQSFEKNYEYYNFDEEAGDAAVFSPINFDKTYDFNKTPKKLTTPKNVNSSLNISINLNETCIDKDLYIYKTGNVTPKPDYDSMELNELHANLKMIGVKKLSRKKSVFMLEYVYNKTHPIINKTNECDKIKTTQQTQPPESSTTSTNIIGTFSGIDFSAIDDNVDYFKFDSFSSNLNAEEHSIYLQSKPRSSKINYCPLPLHVAFYNLFRANSKLRKTILMYQPIELEKLYCYFKSIGYKYEINDLIAFLDKRCITFRTDTKKQGSRVKK